MDQFFPDAARLVLRNAAWQTVERDDAGERIIAHGDTLIADGKFAQFGGDMPEGLPSHDMRDGLVLPGFADIHTHLDKGHIFARSPNPDGTFMGALLTAQDDREARWSADDLAQRMDFALRCAYAHGTVAVRTHLDSIGKQTGISWPVFDEMRSCWSSRISLQAVALFPTDMIATERDEFDAIVATVVRYGGVLGGVTFRGEPVSDITHAGLDAVMQAATANGLDLDFHVDESSSPDARTLEAIADAALRNRFTGKILCGHCCSLALMEDADRKRVISKLGEARIAVVSLPMCNMYLQDRIAGRTPRWRGVAPLHELAAAGIDVMIASDNTRDPFYAYGDLDMLEVMREGTRILQFDHPYGQWLDTVSATPASVMGLDGIGLRAGAVADCILVGARTLNELSSRSWSDRIVLRSGKAIKRCLPDYRDLDSLTSMSSHVPL